MSARRCRRLDREESMSRERTSPVKDLLACAVLVVGGLAAVTYGVQGLADDTVTCGGDVMSSGDSCMTWAGSASGSRSFAEQAAHNERNGYLAIGGGILGVALGGGGAWAGRRSRRARRASPAETSDDRG